MSKFVDKVTLHIAAGDGGNGCASVHREKFKPLGGPDGGNGGRGGDVILRVDPQTTTLLEYHRSPHRVADKGRPGQGSNRHGADGKDMVLSIPEGTVVRSMKGNGEPGEILADLVGVGTEFVVAAGGRGGLGNAALASKRRKAPGFALLGEPGEASSIIIELKTVADVALVGFPSAGKSSLIAAISAATPKIADYPFTTLVPNLGVVQAGDVRFTVADVPGLIPGASQGKGLGLEFLRHVERCEALVHVLDCETLDTDRDPISDLDVLLHELRAYPMDDDPDTVPLHERPAVVALNKTESPDGQALADMVRPELEQRGYQVYDISAVTRQGLKELTFAMARVVQEARDNAPIVEAPRIVLRPKAVNHQGFTITRENMPGAPDDEQYRVRGAQPQRWVAQTDFSNDEAVGYLADRLARLGVEDELYKAGAVAGSQVLIGSSENAVVFIWEPTLMSGAGHLGGRGTDVRLEESHRPTRADKKREFHERMDAKQAARDELKRERQSGVWSDPSEETR